MSTQTAQDLQAAHDYLQANGWCQAKFAQGVGQDFHTIGNGSAAYDPSDVDGRKVCLEGALYVGAHLGERGGLQYFLPQADTWDRYHAAVSALTSLLPPSSVSEATRLWIWNDHSGRTVEEVKGLLQQAIENELAQETSSALA